MSESKLQLNVLGVSGSLRKGSFNTALLNAARSLAPEGVTIAVAEPLDRLPHFNPDLDSDDAEPIQAVQAWRSAIERADGLLIASPEYAHDIPGVLKNALDWIVSSEAIVNKPIAVITASPNHLGAVKAQASLVKTLSVLSNNVIKAALLSVPAVNKKIDSEGRLVDPETTNALKATIEALVSGIRDSR